MKNQYLIRIEYWNMWQPLHVPRMISMTLSAQLSVLRIITQR